MLTKEQKSELKDKTAARKEKMVAEFSNLPDITVFKNEPRYDQMIQQVGIPFTAFCEHHEIQFSGSVSIAYIPGDWLIGLSKLARVVEYHLNPTRYTIQERETHNIISYLQKIVKPKGLMVVVDAIHSCVSYRGVKKPSTTITSAVSGIFAKEGNNAKQEFLSLLQIYNKQIVY